MTPSGPKWVGVGSVRVRYYDEGQGETVLLLHGLGGFAEHWWKNIDPLSRRFRVIAPDIVGFGLTDKPEADYTLGYFVEFVSAFVNALGIARTAIIGTSLGGAVAMQRALSDPGSVGKLVLVASVGLAERAGGFIRSLLLPIAESLSIRPSRWMLKFGYRHVVHRYRPNYGVLIERHYDVMRSGGRAASVLRGVPAPDRCRRVSPWVPAIGPPVWNQDSRPPHRRTGRQGDSSHSFGPGARAFS